MPSLAREYVPKYVKKITGFALATLVLWPCLHFLIAFIALPTLATSLYD